ncbi:MAG: nuclear transport factor 2 family protein, partial [Betaproteobacteria bacterium]|nr:nuclear transport factor 2 family protein [Betaproteobacteria bacterium]
EEGKIAEHRDYWDAAEELYEKIPLLRWLMRWLRRKIASG